MFSLATWNIKNSPTPVLQVNGKNWAIADIAPDLLQPIPALGLLNVFDNWSVAEPVLLKLAEDLVSGKNSASPLTAQVQPQDVLAPLLYPRKLVLAGANYYDHLRIDAKLPD